MVLTDLNQIAQSILTQAREKGSVLPSDVRAELSKAGQAEQRWKEVIGLVRTQLRYSKGRYHYLSAMAARAHQERLKQRSLTRAIRNLIHNYRKVNVEVERRESKRIHFLQPLKVVRPDGATLDFVCQDLSFTGMRFLGPTDLRGLVVKIIVPTFDTGGGQWTFTLRVLWSHPLGEQFIQGGVFLDATRTNN